MLQEYALRGNFSVKSSSPASSFKTTDSCKGREDSCSLQCSTADGTCLQLNGHFIDGILKMTYRIRYALHRWWLLSGGALSRKELAWHD